MILKFQVMIISVWNCSGLDFTKLGNANPLFFPKLKNRCRVLGIFILRDVKMKKTHPNEDAFMILRFRRRLFRHGLAARSFTVVGRREARYG